MTFLGALNAILRYLGRFLGQNLTSNAFLEGQWYLFSCVFLLCGAAALRKDRHVRVDLFYDRLSQSSKAWIDLLGLSFLLIPMMIFSIWASLEFVISSWDIWEVSADAGGLPRYPIKTVLLFSFGLLFLQGISETVHRISFLKKSKQED
ncbi:MAG: C4-dicarboxylate ABC transporter substrate-binding protein [Proteobacteria bacterium]|nr:C4-dicarboxylate ABC transporter substrate-binding protein [Pseudomonadota bacterium]